jgi:VanZ family protein
MQKFIKYWMPPIIWMAFIFLLSSRQRISVADEYILNFLFFKTLHMIEYAILFFLFFRAYHHLNDDKKSLQKIFALAFFSAVIFAISDEIHQYFVPTREGTIRDVFIDSLGIFFMFICIRMNIKKLKKYL